MKDLFHAKLVRLMNIIEGLEEQIDDFGNEHQENEDQKKLLTLKNELTEECNELKRICDGCGHR